MSITFTVLTNYEDESFSSIVELIYECDICQNIISLYDLNDLSLWDNVIESINTGTEYSYNDGDGPSSSCISMDDDNVCIEADVNGCGGGNISTKFRVNKKVFLPIAIDIRQTMATNGHI